MICAAWYSVVRTAVSPTRLIEPVTSVSPDWYFLGVIPKCAPTDSDLLNRWGSSMYAITASASTSAASAEFMKLERMFWDAG